MLFRSHFCLRFGLHFGVILGAKFVTILLFGRPGPRQDRFSDLLWGCLGVFLCPFGALRGGLGGCAGSWVSLLGVLGSLGSPFWTPGELWGAFQEGLSMICGLGGLLLCVWCWWGYVLPNASEDVGRVFAACSHNSSELSGPGLYRYKSYIYIYTYVYLYTQLRTATAPRGNPVPAFTICVESQ